MSVLLVLALALLARPAWATFPTVIAVNGGGTSANTTSHVLNLPSGCCTAGELIVMVLTTGFSSVFPATWPSGWTSRCQVQVAFDVYVRTRVADGTEGATITVDSGSSVASAHTSYRISGQHASTAPEADCSASGVSANPNPPLLNPTNWDAEDTLWFAVTGYESGTNSITAYPSSYTNGRDDTTTGGSDTVRTGSARRELNAASEDPGTFTLNVSNNWIAGTIAIRPAAGAAAGSCRMARLGVC